MFIELIEPQRKSKFANNGTLSPEKRLIARRHSARGYGLTLEEADALRSKVKCEICGIKAKRMVIDHKEPKTFRGVLCQQCNTRLGWVERNLEVINEYIKRGPQNATDKINEQTSV